VRHAVLATNEHYSLVACFITAMTSAGHRLKIHVPKEGVTIAMAPSGVRAPQRPMPAMGGRPAAAGEPYGLEAYAWTREHFNQREVGAAVAALAAAPCTGPGLPLSSCASFQAGSSGVCYQIKSGIHAGSSSS
jgi:hypothetical protein